MTFNELITQFSRYVNRINDADVSQMCGLAEGTTSATLKTTNQIVYNVYNNTGIVKAATDNITMTACAVQPISSSFYYLVSIDAAGAVTVTLGSSPVYSLPSPPAGNVSIGALLVTTDGSHTFTSGTTDLSATGITTAFFDIDTGIASTLINQAQLRLERGVTIIRNGRQKTISNFDHMLVRATATVDQGDTDVAIPFTGYKDFVDQSLTITDSNGVVYPLDKNDVLPLGLTSTQSRPLRIARLPAIETVFDPDAPPSMVFNIWPESDATYTIDVTAYQYSPPLDGVVYSTNWLTQHAPDILLFGALVETAAYFPADERMAEWKDRWQEAVFTLFESQTAEKYDGAFIRTRFPNPMNTWRGNGISSNVAGIMSYGYLNKED